MLTLDRPVTYQIKEPGRLDKGWLDWVEEMAVSIENDN